MVVVRRSAITRITHQNAGWVDQTAILVGLRSLGLVRFAQIAWRNRDYF